MKILQRKIQIYEIVRLAKEDQMSMKHHALGSLDDRNDYSGEIVEVQDDNDPDSEGTWITTKQGKHILIDPKDGTIEAGNIGVARQGDKLHPQSGGQFRENFSEETKRTNEESRQREERKEDTGEDPKVKQEQPKAEQPKETTQTEQTSETSQQNTDPSQNGNLSIDPSEGEQQEQNHSQEQNQSEQTQTEQSESEQSGSWYTEEQLNRLKQESLNRLQQARQQAQEQKKQQRQTETSREHPAQEEQQESSEQEQPSEQEQSEEQPQQSEQQTSQQSQQQEESESEYEPSDQEWQRIQRAMHPQREQQEGSEQSNSEQSAQEQTEQSETTEQQSEQSTQEQSQQPKKSKKKGHIVQQSPATPQSTDRLPEQRQKIVKKYQDRLRAEMGNMGGRPDVLLDQMARDKMCIKLSSLINGKQMFFIPQNPFDTNAAPRWIPCTRGTDGQVVPMNDKVYDSATVIEFAHKSMHGIQPLDLGGQFKQYSDDYEEQVQKEKEEREKKEAQKKKQEQKKRQQEQKQKRKEEAQKKKQEQRQRKQEQRKKKQEQRQKKQEQRQKQKEEAQKKKQQQQQRKQQQRKKRQEQRQKRQEQRRKQQQERRKAQQQKQRAAQQKKKDQQWNNIKKKYGLSDEYRDIIEKLDPQQQQRVAQAMTTMQKPLTRKQQKQVAKQRIRQAKEQLRAAKAAKKGVHHSTKGTYSEFKRAVNGSTADIGGQKFVRQNGVWKNVQSGKVVGEKDLANLVTAIKRNQRHAKYDLNDIAGMRMDRAKNTQQARHALKLAQRGAMMIVGGVTYRKDKDGKWIGNNNSTLTESQLARYSIRAKKAGISSGFYQKKPFTTGVGFKERMQQLNGG